MFLLANEYMFMIENNRVALFYGRVGSYKTLSAIATAYHLLKTKRFQRCYANIPVSFATSPPVKPEDFDFLDQTYASDSIFIIDESALFLSGKHEQIKQIFAFPRKINQVFLLASVLPTKQVTDYAHVFVHRGFNFPMIGIPIVHFLTTTDYKSSNKKKYISHFLSMPSRYYTKYASKFRPDSMYPIYQYRDSGVLYDKFSRIVPEEVREYFFIDGWGQAIRKKNLSLEETEYVQYYSPEFDVLDALDSKNEFPRLKQKRTIKNFLSSEFNMSFVLNFLFVIYITITIITFIGNTGANEIPMTEWKSCDYTSVLMWRNHNECRGTTKTNHSTTEKTQATQATPATTKTTPTPQVVEYKYE